jgi:hypothetical protein
MSYCGSTAPAGSLSAVVITRAEKARAAAAEARRWRLRNRLRMLARGELLVPLLARLAARYPGLGVIHGTLRGRLTRADGSVLDLGVMGHHLVTTAGKNFIAGCFNNTNEPEVLKYHGLGTGTTAAALADTALQTECTTALNPDSTRATGSQSVTGAVYTTVGTNTFDATAAVTEWGLLSQAATGGGTLLDHQIFSALNMASGDSLQTTYTFTIS